MDPDPKPTFSQVAAKVDKQEAQILNLNSRLTKLEEEVERNSRCIKGYASAIPNLGTEIMQLRAKLKETIRAVERLAKGKSLGTLGLPTEESWEPPA